MREYTPNVIEPSFGIGRILYSLLEHSYWAREQDIARGVSRPTGVTPLKPRLTPCYAQQVLSFPPLIAPIKCLIVPLSSNEAFNGRVAEVCEW